MDYNLSNFISPFPDFNTSAALVGIQLFVNERFKSKHAHSFGYVHAQKMMLWKVCIIKHLERLR